MILGMSPFQFVLLLVLAAALLSVIVVWLRGGLRSREALPITAVLIAAGFAVWWPDLTSIVARSIGIGRGTDLTLYVAVLAMLAGFWMIYIRLRRLRREVTLLVRHIAILEAEAELREAEPPSAPPANTGSPQ
jgi:hypothetical protein